MGATLIVSLVVAMQNDPTSGASDNDDDLVLEQDGQIEQVDVKCASLGEVAHVQDHALDSFDLHGSLSSSGDHERKQTDDHQATAPRRNGRLVIETSAASS